MPIPGSRCRPPLRATAVEADADHRAHAAVELAIRDLKDGAGLEQRPSGRFYANCAWAVLASVAHNLLRWVHLPGVPTIGPVVAKTQRRKLLALPGGFTRGGRHNRSPPQTAHLARPDHGRRQHDADHDIDRRTPPPGGAFRLSQSEGEITAWELHQALDDNAGDLGYAIGR